jgi:hypothetical protein
MLGNVALRCFPAKASQESAFLFCSSVFRAFEIAFFIDGDYPTRAIYVHFLWKGVLL